ncbi:MAG: DMT family transporter [Clostridiales bacterium]|nr:DMT family transporter [Clostridiales bacterium]
MKTQVKADMMLVLVAMCWGSSCLLTKIALEDLQEFNLIAIRFLIGFALTAVVFFRRLGKDKKAILYAAMLSANYFVVVAFMTFGVQYTTVSKAGFLTCLAGVFVPIICFFVFKRKLDRKTVFCVAATFVGVYMLTMSGAEDSGGINLGDVLCTLCSLFFAVHILLTGHFVKRADPLVLAVFQMGFVGGLNLIASFIFEAPHLPTTETSWLSVLLLAVLCSVFGTLFQNMAQKHTSETHAGIILTLEPAFAVMFAYAFLKETLTGGGYAGAIVLLVSIVILEVDFSKGSA